MLFGGIYDAGFARLAQGMSSAEPGRAGTSPTQEMIDHFYNRTNHHIELVRKYCARLEDRLPELEGLFERGFRHDEGKFEPEEFLPYVWLTWRYKCKDDGVPCELPTGVEEAINEATEHHILTNAHHPEFHQRKSEDVINEDDRDAPPDEVVNAVRMETFDLAEMVADFCAMSEERGNTPHEWFEKNLGVRWNFTPEQVDQILRFMDAAWEG